METVVITYILPLIVGWILDRLWGDPINLPHPVVAFGKLISYGEKRLNKGENRKIKGALFAILCIVLVFVISAYILLYIYDIDTWLLFVVNSIGVFFCLSGKTLSKEVKDVFIATDQSLADGRRQVARIVGRDTSGLDEQQIRTAALETLAENLSDGVVAPMFWYLIFGLPGMLAYKMVNTLDSMIGYKSPRFKEFGCVAARIDDVANYIPARITALLMIVCNGRLSLLSFVKKYARRHASPNSGYPESALAAILDCKFGGPNTYFGQVVDKPYIGSTHKVIDNSDLKKAVSINFKTELCMLLLVLVCILIFYGNGILYNWYR